MTKGKLSKLLNKQKQTMKKINKGKKRKNTGRRTFRNVKHLNLMKKTFKKLHGGDNEVVNEVNIKKEYDKIEDVEPNTIEKKDVMLKEENIIPQEESNIDAISFFENSKERENEIDNSDSDIQVMNDILESEPSVMNDIPESETPVINTNVSPENTQMTNTDVIDETPFIDKENNSLNNPTDNSVSVTINTTMDDLINNVAKRVILLQQNDSRKSIDQNLLTASITNAENA